MYTLYVTTIILSSTSKYGSIPFCRVPFLIGEPDLIHVIIVKLCEERNLRVFKENLSSIHAIIVKLREVSL